MRKPVICIGICSVEQLFHNRFRDIRLIEIELDHVPLVPMPCLMDIGMLFQYLVELGGIPFQLHHIPF